MGNAGYELMSLANNHAADSDGPGLISTSEYLTLTMNLSVLFVTKNILF
ncbi:MAG: hypothetical protein GX326_02560 [Clostridiaceae bacterium]|nr:hypothetical protein [Clostridiaceae bacterium]